MAGTSTVTVLRPKRRTARAFPAPPPQASLPRPPVAQRRLPLALLAPGVLVTALWPRALGVLGMSASMALTFAAGALFWHRASRLPAPSQGG